MAYTQANLTALIGIIRQIAQSDVPDYSIPFQTLLESGITGGSSNPFSDSSALVKNGSDNTKLAIFSAASITAGATRTYTLPDISDTFVTLTAAQTLTNKTLGNTNTLSIKDTLFTLQDDGDATKLLAFQLSGISPGNIRTLTIPDVSDTLVTLGATQTLTSKTLTTPKFVNGGSIIDGNANALLTFTTTASAVNGVTFANAATGTNPTFTANGADADVGIILLAKGIGSHTLQTATGPKYFTAKSTNSGLQFSELIGTNTAPAVYDNAVTPNANNYLLASVANNAFGILNSTTNTCIRVGNVDIIKATAGTATFTGNCVLGTAGNGHYVKQGANATFGTAVANGASEVTVSTNKVTASSAIFITCHTVGGTPGSAYFVSSRSAGVSFGFKAVAADTSTVDWWILEPAP